MATMRPASSFRLGLEALPLRYRTPSPPPPDAVEPLTPGGAGGAYLSWRPEQTTPSDATHGLGLSLAGFVSSSPRDEMTVTQQLWVDTNGQARVEPFNSDGIKINTARRSNTYDDHKPPFRKDGPHKTDRKGHARSGSNMDALATIALATSPTFSQGSATFTQNPWTLSPHLNGDRFDYALDERPAKRAKSEKLPSPQMIRKELRPATSHVASLQSMKDDAELLLNFAQPHNFPPLAINTLFQRTETAQTSPPYQGPRPSAMESEKKPGGLTQNGEPGVNQPASTEHRTEMSGGDVVDLRNGGLGPQTESESQISSLGDQLVDAAAAAEASPTEGKERKPRRVQPTTQAPCAKCNSLQANVESDDQDGGLTSWIGCNGCSRWFHIVCAGFKDRRETRAVDKYICPDCEPAKGPTTYVRTSSRVRTAIDYAGLHQGMIRSSEEMAEHHFLKPIKDGTIKFQPDDFARIRPEILTMEYLEKTDGLKRPIVIPACWNPRFGRDRVKVKSDGEDAISDISKLRSDEGGNPIPPLADELGSIPQQGDDTEEEVIDCGQDLLDMVIPENLTVRRVAELHGPEMALDVIDVKSQQTAQRWNLRKWADYYESTADKTIRNVISLEVSQSKLGKLLRRPRIVRDLDLQDDVWPLDLPSKAVQFYCLMSVADCYTDFHIDFGGSSVYYHILKGKKTFFFIPPEEKHLKKYEQWNNSPLQNQTFLGDVTGDCSRVDLTEGDTMLIPSGWIHAVWTPENSLVIGGNFLTRMSYEMQIKINRIEIDTKTALKFRYPLFQKVNWYAAIGYVEDDPVPDHILHDFQQDPSHVFLRANPVWHEFGELRNSAEPGDALFNLRFYSRMEIEGLPALRDYLYRTALIASDYQVEGVNESTRTNVKKSIPKGHGDPIDLVRRFAIWVAWKTGCVTAPDWVQPDSQSLAVLARIGEKQKKVDVRTPGERTSSRVQSQMQHARVETVERPVKQPKLSIETEAGKEEVKRPKKTPKTSGLGPQRFACDTCRKRRIRCHHKDAEAVTHVVGPTAETDRPKTPSSIFETPQPQAQPQPRPQPQSQLYDTTTHLDGPSSPTTTTPDSAIASQQDSATIPSNEMNGLNGQPTPSENTLQESPRLGRPWSKKGRSKACEECRKSKRRCIHDENGQVDPGKAAEPSKPRGSTCAKRPSRLSGDLAPPLQKARMNGEDEQAPPTTQHSHHSPAIDEVDSVISASSDRWQAPNNTDQATDPENDNTKAELDSAIENAVDDPVGPTRSKPTIHIDAHHESPPLLKGDKEQYNTAAISLATSSSQISANSLVSPPDSVDNEDDGETIPVADHGSRSFHNGEVGQESSNGSSVSSTSTTASLVNPLQTPQSCASRHSSRLPKPVDRYVPDANPSSPDNATVKQQGSASTSAVSSRSHPSARRASGGATGAKSTSAVSAKQRTGTVTQPPKTGQHDAKQYRDGGDSSSGGGGGGGGGGSDSSIDSVSDSAARPRHDKEGRKSEKYHTPSCCNPHPPASTNEESGIAKSEAPKSETEDQPPEPPSKSGKENKKEQGEGGNEKDQDKEREKEEEKEKKSLELIRALHEEEFGLRRRSGHGGAAAQQQPLPPYQPLQPHQPPLSTTNPTTTTTTTTSSNIAATIAGTADFDSDPDLGDGGGDSVRVNVNVNVNVSIDAKVKETAVGTE